MLAAPFHGGKATQLWRPQVTRQLPQALVRIVKETSAYAWCVTCHALISNGKPCKAEAHRVRERKLEGRGVPLHPELGTLCGLSQAGSLQLVQSWRSSLNGLLVGLVLGSRHASKGKGGDGNS